MPKKRTKKTKLALSSPVSQLKGLGTKTAHRAKLLGIKTVKNLLTYFPFRYNDYKATDLENEPDKAKVTMTGRVDSIPNRKYHGKANVESFRLAYDHDHKSTNISFFNCAWLIYKVHQNDNVIIYGQVHTWTDYQGTKHVGINGSRIKVINSALALADVVKPIYPSSHGIKQATIQKMIKQGWEQAHQLIKNIVPASIRKKYKLEDEATAIHDMQFPKSAKAEQLARRTAKFNEFYQYELKVAKLKQRHNRKDGIAVNYDKKLLRKFDNALPFTMTSGQLRSVAEIVNDLHSKHQMNRLLQGDVGSGKTVVAAFGILATISAGYQASIMIPTSVLGEQHYKTFTKLFKGLNINILLLTGDMTLKEQQNAYSYIADGTAQLIIGTDALIQPDVKFKKLGLAVIDEQHKFGVDQRRALIEKGQGVNALSMSATPIPRTLAITAYGNMDVSIIDTLPKGRKPVITKWIYPNQFYRYVQFFKGLLAKGQQAYCVVPLVQQSDSDSDDKSDKDKQTNYHDKHNSQQDKLDAITAYQHFTKLFKPYKVGLLYGPMSENEKDKVLHDFKTGKIQFLVSTTVVEVGVDAPKATMMIICNADSYGLAQLHQLRGRVGRNSLQSYCILISHPSTPIGQQRMKVMEKTNNGFIVSQEDLELRGSGNIFSGQQSGDLQFPIADIVNDSTILEYARKEAMNQVKRHKS